MSNLQTMDALIQFSTLDEKAKVWTTVDVVPEGLMIFDTDTKKLYRGDGVNTIDNTPVHIDFGIADNPNVQKTRARFLLGDLSIQDGCFLQVDRGGKAYSVSRTTAHDLKKLDEYLEELKTYAPKDHNHDDIYYTKKAIVELIGDKGSTGETAWSSNESKLISYLLMNSQEKEQTEGLTFIDGKSWEFEEKDNLEKYIDMAAGNTATIVNYKNNKGYSILNRAVTGINIDDEVHNVYVSPEVEYTTNISNVVINLRATFILNKYNAVFDKYKVIDLSTVDYQGKMSDLFIIEVSRDGGESYSLADVYITPLKVAGYYAVNDKENVAMRFLNGGTGFRTKREENGSIDKNATFSDGNKLRIRITNKLKGIKDNNNDYICGNRDRIEVIVHGIKFSVN